MKNGAVQDVIDALSSTVREAGKTPKLYANMVDLVRECTSNPKGVSPCYAGVVFHSSPREGSVDSVKGFWNYTILGDKTVSGDSDIRRNGLGTDVYMLPLQRALDQEIISRSMSNNTSVLPPIVEDIPFTFMPQEALIAERTGNYLTLCIYVFGAIFSFTMIGIVFHLTSFVSGERELGMSSLIDTMLPGGSATRARMVRQVSTYISFVLIYLPSWLVVGVVISVVVFPTTSHGIPVGYHILSGLAFCSFGQFGAAFFKKAQLSGSIMIVITLVFAILPQV
jgi:ATP-binding cassette subfamily A (ABC1) protein 3